MFHANLPARCRAPVVRPGAGSLRFAVALLLAGLLLRPAPLPAAAPTDAPPAPAGTARLEVGAGVLVGRREGPVHVFRGIPYAAPPIGARRFRPPRPAPVPDGTVDARRFGPACLQAPYPRSSVYWRPAEPQSDDCLTLNVWTRFPEPGAELPVMVWFHGGGLTRGSGSVPAYDGAALSGRGVVVVTVNYRLNVFGFLAHPALRRESPHRSAGNYGVLDQIAALEWVREHIRAFGGDPDNVTIFGESAGSTSVNVLMASPLAQGLFHRAIGQSGGRMGATAALRGSRRSPGAERLGRRFARSLGASGARDLRALPASALLDGGVAWDGPDLIEPLVDGWVLEASVREVFENGEQAPVPVIVGYNADEGTTLAGHRVPEDAQAWGARVRRELGSHAERFLELYDPVQDLREAFLASYRDRRFGWPMHTWARLTETARQPAWLYLFTHAPATDPPGALGAYHGAELRYVFGNLPDDATDGDRALSALMMDYWTGFARDGAPNDPDRPRWPVYTGGRRAYLEFGRFVAPGDHLDAAAMAFWEAVWADPDVDLEP